MLGQRGLPNPRMRTSAGARSAVRSRRAGLPGIWFTGAASAMLYRYGSGAPDGDPSLAMTPNSSLVPAAAVVGTA